MWKTKEGTFLIPKYHKWMPVHWGKISQRQISTWETDRGAPSFRERKDVISVSLQAIHSFYVKLGVLLLAHLSHITFSLLTFSNCARFWRTEHRYSSLPALLMCEEHQRLLLLVRAQLQPQPKLISQWFSRLVAVQQCQCTTNAMYYVM